MSGVCTAKVYGCWSVTEVGARLLTGSRGWWPAATEVGSCWRTKIASGVEVGFIVASSVCKGTGDAAAMEWA